MKLLSRLHAMGLLCKLRNNLVHVNTKPIMGLVFPQSVANKPNSR